MNAWLMEHSEHKSLRELDPWHFALQNVKGKFRLITYVVPILDRDSVSYVFIAQANKPSSVHLDFFLGEMDGHLTNSENYSSDSCSLPGNHDEADKLRPSAYFVYKISAGSFPIWPYSLQRLLVSPPATAKIAKCIRKSHKILSFACFAFPFCVLCGRRVSSL